ncbi:PIN domain-containing protein [uncultured Sphingomonas sp.]|uniref:PIN domain-containing protein n=2 Tax=uncultured Sphingomonas sp. TaxID=158754 RepID=UPI0025D25880|nr:PIN domain-containing protein [uncultured Sphingomonas sp.]
MRGDFFDTDILVYTASADDLRFERAEALLSGGGAISVQMLNEFTNVARRKMALDWPEIQRFLNGVCDLFNVIPLSVSTYRAALGLAQRYRFSVNDAVMVAGALESDATTLFTENLHDGLLIDGRLRVINPFSDLTP